MELQIEEWIKKVETKNCDSHILNMSITITPSSFQLNNLSPSLLKTYVSQLHRIIGWKIHLNLCAWK